jgi:hypothetical protein
MTVSQPHELATGASSRRMNRRRRSCTNMSRMGPGDRVRRSGRPAGRRARAAALMVVLAVFASGCALRGLAFVKDSRLALVGFPDRSHIVLPHDVTWRFTGALADPATAPPGAPVAFAVLVDWTPPPPGRSLASLLASDPTCRRTGGCPAGYLARNRIYVTTDTTFHLANVSTGTDRNERRSFHELTVVLVDASGRRVGETAASTRFRIPGIHR